MNYGQDERTREKMLKDYRYGKKAEDLILQRLEEYFRVEKSNSTDKEGEFDKYSEDALIGYGDSEWKIEIKFTKKHLNWVQWKENQFKYAQLNQVNLLQISDKRIAWIPYTQKGYYLEKGYCNKPCYSFKPEWLDSFEELRNLLLLE